MLVLNIISTIPMPPSSSAKIITMNAYSWNGSL
jgi:hypothetical protein